MSVEGILISSLDTFTGTPSNTDYLAIDDGTATKKINTKGLLVDANIAPVYSTSATYAVGDYVYYNGDLYRCITAIATAEAWASGHWAKTAITSDIDGLKNDLSECIEYKPIALTPNHGIPISIDLGGTVDYNNPVSRSDIDCAVVACTEGDVFTINSMGGATYRAFAFLDSNGASIYTVKPFNGYLTISNGVVKAPPDSAYLVINNIHPNVGTSYYGKVISVKEGENEAFITSKINNTDETIKPKDLINGSLSTAGNYANGSSNSKRLSFNLFLDLSKYDYLTYNIDSGYRMYFQFYSSPRPSAVAKNVGWVTGNEKLAVYAPYMRFICASVGDATALSVSDYSHFSVTGHYKNSDIADTMKFSFTPAASASQGRNDGVDIRVMSYNVANYNNDTETYISNDQLLEFRKMLNKADADFVCVQENATYIDGETKESYDYIYLPKYPQKHGTAGCVIHQKIGAVDGGGKSLTYSNGRQLRYGTFQLTDDIKLLICNTHMVYNYESSGGTSATSIAARQTQYTELFQWINGDITLTDTSTSQQVSAPSHTHCIICMDANCATDTDKENLASLASDYDFILGNGGYLGWFYTELRLNYAIDEIIVSDNIIINNIEAWSHLYTKLYSDHTPLIADLTLL